MKICPFVNNLLKMNVIDKSANQWFVMRDLHRGISHTFMYKELSSQGFETYTPLVKSRVLRQGKAIIVERPYIRDLFFIHSSQTLVEACITSTSRCQFRYRLGVRPASPIVVPDNVMENFIRVNTESESPDFLAPSDIPDDVRNRRVRVVGGPLDGVEGMLKSVRGSKYKTLYVELPGIMAISTVCKFDYIQLL